MTHKARIRIAAAITAIFLGGLTALGVGIQSNRAEEKVTTPQPLVKTQVINETRVRTVRTTDKQPKVVVPQQAQPAPTPVVSATPRQVASAPVAQMPRVSQPVVVTEPKQVSSRTSPVGSNGEGEEAREASDDGEREGEQDDD